MRSSSVPRNTDVNVGSKYDDDKDGSSSDKEDSGDFGSAKAHNLIKYKVRVARESKSKLGIF